MKPFLGAAFLSLAAMTAQAQTIHSGDGSIIGSLCTGDFCTATETFTDTPFRVKDDRINIEFDDVSSPSFPNTDWAIKINDNASLGLGGQNHFTIQDKTAGTDIFRLDAGASSNSFYMANDGHIGLGTSLPQSELHIVGSTSTPGILLEDTIGTPQKWWITANNANFSLVNGDDELGAIPFLISAYAPGFALTVKGDGNVGIGTNDSESPLHVLRSTGPASATAGILVENTGPEAARGLLNLRNNGQVYFGLEDTSIAAGPDSGRSWNFQNLGGTFRVTTAPGGAGEVEMVLDVDGNMTIEGNYFASSGTQLNVPDYVFEEGYELRPLSEVASFIAANKHLPDVPSAQHINAKGLNMTDMQMRLLKKVEELTLYTLEQEQTIAAHAAKDLLRDRQIEDCWRGWPAWKPSHRPNRRPHPLLDKGTNVMRPTLIATGFCLLLTLPTAVAAQPVQQHNTNAVWFENWIGLSQATMRVASPDGEISDVFAERGHPGL